MKRTKFQRIIALLLATVFLISGSVIVTYAATGDSTTDITTEDIKAMLNAIPYSSYVGLAEHADIKTATKENGFEEYKFKAYENFTFEPANSQPNATATVETYDGKTALLTPESGKVSWVFSGIKSARYYVEIDYYPIKNKSASIERIFSINGTVPFKEARYLTMPKIWKNVYSDGEFELGDGDAAKIIENAANIGIEASLIKKYSKKAGAEVDYISYKMPEYWTQDRVANIEAVDARFFIHDIDKNEIRPSLEQSPAWTTYTFKDASGFRQYPFEFVIVPDKDGNVTFTLEAVNEPMAISEIRLALVTKPDSYGTYTEKINAAGATAGKDMVKIEAEYYSATSSQTIYPFADTTSASNSPSAVDRTVLNVVGGDKWQTAGQWVEYDFAVKTSGKYKISTRFMQNLLDGMSTTRMLYIYSDSSVAEGELGYYGGMPFDEAGRLKFNYKDGWQSGFLTDGNKAFEFYFKEGVRYTLRFEVSLGGMGSIVNRVQQSLDALNADYLKIIKLTGTDPDEYRDYGFRRIMPEVLGDFKTQKDELKEISKLLENEAGGKSSMSTTLDKIVRLLEGMLLSDDNIAKNLAQLKTNIGTLGTWVSDAKTQPLIFDYIVIQPSDDSTLPEASPGFFKSLMFEIKGFFQSFFRNYDRMGAMQEIKEGEGVEVWLATGRDQSQVMRNLINNGFTYKTNIPVNLKLVAAGTLLPSILAGMGPDVYTGLAQTEVINYAIRGALVPIEDMPGFEETCNDFNEAAMMVLGIEDENRDFHYYGLPETQDFQMMFVREDIFAELDLKIPKTWDDVKETIPVLQANNMEIAMHSDYMVFLYQMGGELFADNGMRINLDSNVALDAFNTMCEMFTMYSFPYKYDFANRFRTGEMPLGFASYTATYNQLKVFATEIEGLWGFYPMPGYADENGNINNVSVSTITAIGMISGCDNQADAWEFMKWHSDAEFQIQYSNEMVAILGPSAKQPTANKEALSSLPWTYEELEQLQYQFNNLASVPNYPGAYIVSRYTTFAFLAAYNDKADPITELKDYIPIINEEITRKRDEYDLEILEKGQTLAQLRMEEAESKLKNIMKNSDSYNSAYDAICNSILELIDGYETEDFASIRSLAASLEKLNSSLFAEVVSDLRSSANALESYEAYK